MPSPFPGMDPWLEDAEIFPNLHECLIVYLNEALNGAMPAGYVATIRNRVWIDDVQRREPDVSVFGKDRTNGNGGTAVLTLTGLHALGTATTEEIEEPYLEILSPKGKRLITAVEVLSLSNKKSGGPGRQAYLDKHQEFRRGGVNVVEIDLLRGGTHTTAVQRARLEQRSPGFSYHILVTVAARPITYHGAMLQLSDRLPAIGIPLERGVAPVVVDLQPLLDRAYDLGRYAALAEYARPPEPALTPEQQTWAEEVLHTKGLLPR